MNVNEKEKERNERKMKRLYESMKHFKMFSWPYKRMCIGTEAKGRRQSSCMICREWLTRLISL
jgi:hypothetical protein